MANHLFYDGSSNWFQSDDDPLVYKDQIVEEGWVCIKESGGSYHRAVYNGDGFDFEEIETLNLP